MTRRFPSRPECATIVGTAAGRRDRFDAASRVHAWLGHSGDEMEAYGRRIIV